MHSARHSHKPLDFSNVSGISAVCAAGLFLLLNNPEEIQDIGRYDGIADNQRASSRGQELIDRPKNERAREKQAPQESPPARSQADLQDSVCDASERQWERTEPCMGPSGDETQI